MSPIYGDSDMSQVSINGQVVNILGMSGSIATLTADLATAQADIIALQGALAAKLGLGIFIAEDEKANGVNGGSSVAGSQTRVLNTVRANNIVGASLAGNQVTLPAGTYRVRATAPSFKGGLHKVYLYNVTDALSSIIGTSENTEAWTQSQSFLWGRIIIAAAKVFELRHYIQLAIATNGLGTNSGSGMVNVYSTIQIFRED